ncbi:MAG: amidohydrolase [Kordiimonadaceae bacterium]|nr:amidohydrolase [Kordiimonadaceae bacterium]MBO6568993.1 amidohydrolase [Kordiimonadaceae bacterium]MBO6964468.1 amidohydrolase [Kordiimonadaceae bacterium]
MKLSVRKALGLSAAVATVFSQVSFAQAQDDYDYLEALYLHLHQNPELSFHEENTAARLALELRNTGYEVTENVGGHGLVAVLKNGEGPTLLIRADMDGLPVKEQTGLPYASQAKGFNDAGDEVSVMHACGHDVHMTSLVGTARAMAADRSGWSGTLVLIGQPAEERVGGAKAMLADGLYERFPKPDFNIALHTSASLPAGQVGLTAGYALANVDSVDIAIKGIGGHGAYPHTTKDPVVLASQIVIALQTLVSRETSPLESAVVTVGSIHSGTKHNIISSSAHLQLTVRSYTDEVRANLLSGIKRIAEAQAHSIGLPEELWPEVTYSEATPSTYNNPVLARRVADVLKDELGSDNVKELTPVMGAEDFAYFGRTEDNIPSVIYWLGAVSEADAELAAAGEKKLPSLHSPFFAPDREPTLKTGTRSLTAVAKSLLQR